ncbi:DNA-binding SARP family transcriptional activator [Lentzea atacamensis]|uniref:DNA-binding SARP family transcriptional activator n=1 Tax=Lentzea atacamensis TaxID=531938 RepID=A0A316IIB1_9PSEU|nr:BTAD domain-containing putative transcriptional regulator [Lentzea atacamensis]PWK90018.1 DNA-binding SARP family transcriptional activator [Lentzea atacamensis]
MRGAEYRVLGPLEVLFNGEPIAVPAGRGRALLATLLMRPNQFVSSDELVDRLWEGSPLSADRATKTLHMTVARLRQALGPANCVSTTTNGYLAEVGNLDLLRFRALAGTDPHAALELWRGPVLSNVDSDALHRDDVPKLVEERLTVLERRIEQDLGRGRASELVPELRSLTAEHPLRERFWAQLMVALYRSDQQAAALEAFREVSDLLADELGIDPGPSLKELHQSILRAEPELTARRDTVVPRQLPPDLGGFTGRDEDLARLDRLLSSGESTQTVVISAIAGSAGVGKTALAVHWAHRVRARFPDGQLAVNLRGYDQENPLTPHDALGQLLRGLGRSAKEIPDDTDQRIGEYRSLLADRRVLVLLDNARAAEQVRPLLPGGRSVALVTSRSDLRGLVALNDAKVLKLGVLPLDEAVQLLGKVIGTNRTDAEPEDTAELARLCACLPLALRIAASFLASEPDLRVRDLVDQLSTEDRLAELEIGDDRQAAVRAAFDLSYTALGPDEQRMFRVLGLAPRADFTPMSAGALMGVPSGQALQLLRTLARAHLVEEHEPQRFSQHDLLRLHARERATREESEESRKAAVVRFLDHHLHSLGNAEAAVPLFRAEKTLTERDPVVEVAVFSDKDAAIAWCRREHDLLFELCEFALAEGHLEHAWKLAYSMISYIQLSCSNEDRSRAFTIALDAARRLGDRFAEAVALHSLGIAAKNRHEFEAAERMLREGLQIRREIGHRRGIAISEAELASTYLWQGRHDEALLHYRESVEQWRLTGNKRGWATSMNSLAYTHVRNGDFVEAIAISEQAFEALEQLDTVTPSAMDTLAQAYAGMGDVGKAAQLYREIFSSHGLGYIGVRPQAEILFHGAQVLDRAGHRQEALPHARQALALAEQGRLGMVADVRQLVRDLEN